MSIYKPRNNRTHRHIYEQHYGFIPNGYHIHHIDGDHTNNDISNLSCVSPQEHYDIHYKQGDYGCCWAMLRSGHLKLSCEERSDLAKKQMKDPKMKKLLSESMKEKNIMFWSDINYRKNREEKISKSWEITYPDGNIVIIKNLNSFCKSHGLTHQNMYSVARGKLKQHKGFSCKEIEK